MGKRLTKRKHAAQERVETGKTYEIGEAIKILTELPTGKFKESVDLAVNLGIDPRQADQNVRGAIVLPHGTGKEIRVAVFAQGANADAAKEAGADVVGLDDLAEQVKAGDFDFDVVIATPDCMRVVGSLGRILGPRGLMPNPKSGTVTPDVADAVKNAKSGQVQYRADRTGIIHGSIGQVGQTEAQLRENVEALIAELRKAKPPSAKGTYIKKVTISTTMGPGIAVEEASIGAA
ncbi:MAG: 50S ribosomal protein L1 [Gammaproteobacteria bacterium]|nr:50S ribosomal protein L1 [Gammaproteobacteria bacterium]